MSEIKVKLSQSHQSIGGVSIDQNNQGIGISVSSGGLAEVIHDNTLKGKGTRVHPLGVADAVLENIDSRVEKTDIADKIYGTDSEGNQTIYDKDSFGQVDDVLVNGTSVVTNKIAEVEVPTAVSQLTNDADYQNGTQVSNTVSSAINTHNTSNDAHSNLLTPITQDIDAIEEKIPAEASSSNQLADKVYVDSKVGDLNEWTTEQYTPTTTNFVVGNTYTVEEAFQRTASLFEGHQGEIDDIEALIPAQTTTQNQLADKNFVNATVATNSANFRGNWATWADVPTQAEQYPEDYVGSRTPTNNDYMVVDDAIGYGSEYDGSWRFIYIGTWATDGKNGWNPVYRIGTAFTQEQQAAIDSGITANMVDNYVNPNSTAATAYNARITAVETDKRDIINSANKVYATDANGANKNDLVYATAATADTIAQRGTNGVLKVGTPTDNADATTKLYVDTIASAKQDTLTAGTNITIDANNVISSTAQESFFRGNFSTWENVPTNVNGYKENYKHEKTPTFGDFMVVADASDYVNPDFSDDPENVAFQRNPNAFTINIIVGNNTISVYYTEIQNTYKTIRELFTSKGYTGIGCEWLKLKYTPGSPGQWYITSTSNYYENNELVSANTDHFLMNTNEPTTSMFYLSQDAGVAPIALFGGWRFSYYGVWTTDGKNGWKPEYQVEDVLPVATDTVAGIAKLYTTTGQNTDGSMTQGSITTALGGKQDTLVSGTNIKTINNESLLGAGNFSLSEQLAVLPEPTSADDARIVQYVGETIRTKHEFVTATQGERTGSLSGYVSDTSILKTKLASINTELSMDCDRLKFVVVSNSSGYYYDVYACEGETEYLYQQNINNTDSVYGIRIGVVGGSDIGTYIYFNMIYDDEYNYSGNFYKCFKKVVVGEKPSAMYVAIINLDLVNSKIAEANETFGITTAKLKFVLTMMGNNQFTVYAVEGDSTEHLMQADINVSNLPSTFGVQIAQTGTWTVGMYAELEYQYYWNEVLELAHLGDVELKDLEDGQALIYDSTTDKWVNGNGGVSATYDATTKTITFA